eukprot:scaffold28501_cov61-Phaeocystis_antarctica.AAC.3
MRLAPRAAGRRRSPAAVPPSLRPLPPSLCPLPPSLCARAACDCVLRALEREPKADGELLLLGQRARA